METTLETLISRGAVDGRLLTLLQQSLPDRLDDVPDGFRLTARDVVVDGRSLRLTTPITRGEGNAVADWGQLMLRVLAVSSVKPPACGALPAPVPTAQSPTAQRCGWHSNAMRAAMCIFGWLRLSWRCFRCLCG